VRLRRLAALTLVAASAAAPGTDAHAQPPVTVSEGLTYGRATNDSGHSQKLALDLYRSDAVASRNAPAVVWIHGGGFVRGNRSDLSQYAEQFAGRGYLSASIDYRLQTKRGTHVGGLPRAIVDAQHDAQAAVRWFRRFAGKLGVNPKRIYVAGQSAGATTALWVADRSEDPGSSGNPGFSSRVRAAVSLSGTGPIKSIDHFDPPALIVHGTADKRVQYSRALATCQAMRAVHAICKMLVFPGEGHEVAFTRTSVIYPAIARFFR
jgi:acetyl esterase/lipase